MERAIFGFFLSFSLLAGIALYALVNYYFIRPEEVFDLQGQKKSRIDAKSANIGDFDFGFFDGEEYGSLRSGTWHSYDRASLRVGNRSPFSEDSK